MYNVLDLFCGAGGLSQGFKMAKFNIIGGIDFEETAIETHKLNFPNSYTFCGDITQFTNKQIHEVFTEPVDVIIGGPPCQGFSSANKWESEEKKKEKNKLFFQFIRFVQELKPKAFLIENVQGILTRDDGYAKNQIFKILDKEGYNVNCKVLLASDYGVPQSRRRAFFVGLKKDYDETFDFNNLVRKEKVTVKDALSDLYDLEDSIKEKSEKIKYPNVYDSLTQYQKYLRKNCNDFIYNHNIHYPRDFVRKRIKTVGQGENWRVVPAHLWERQRTNRHSSAYRRLAESQVSVTIDTGHMNYFHPIFDRVPTVRESARLQSFPDNFIFEGTKTSQFKQVGNAVPPLLAKTIAVEIKNILEKIENKEIR